MVNSLKPIYMPPYLLLSHYCITGGAGNTPNWSSCFCWLYMSCAMTWPVNSGMNVNYLKILIVCTANLSVNSMPPSLTMSFCWLSSAIFFKTNSSTAAWGGWCVAPCHCCRVLLINNARNSKTYTVIVKHRGLIFRVNSLWPFCLTFLVYCKDFFAINYNEWVEEYDELGYLKLFQFSVSCQ